MILSRLKPAVESHKFIGGGKSLPKFNDFLAKRDYTGALTFLEFKKANNSDVEIDLWMGYCAFHLGDYKKAMEIYKRIYNNDKNAPNIAYNLACCYFYLGMNDESDKLLQIAPPSSHVIRLALHLAQRKGHAGAGGDSDIEEEELLRQHQRLHDSLPDQLSLAAVHYMRAHYQEAIDIYKRILLNNREYLALNVYVALCYYKLDYYDVSQEVLSVYLNQYPDSAIANNLKACNAFRLFNGQTAISEIQNLAEQTSVHSFGHDLVRHNIVVFRQGEGALQVFPPLLDVIPEARLNLVIHYLKDDNAKDAFELIKDLSPSVPHEYILKGTVYATLGQEQHSVEYIKAAQQCFQLVGSSTSECDTIPGRQCMASTFFLFGQFEEVLVYLTTIRSFYFNNDTFNYNYGQAKAATGNYKEAEEAFLLIEDTKLKSDSIYLTNLARCFIMNKKSQRAWDLYMKNERKSCAYKLLQIIANDCYKMGDFWYSAKAFDILEKIEPTPEYWEGKRGAVVGIFQGVIANILPKEMIYDAIELIAKHKQNPQAEQILRIIKKWSKENGLNI
ncbi:intraflagellar transport protein 56 [Chrysoperla carnea]|uniref:intraflagellar transport protein 56 n=1 Tax=Chrysoperla carnea TaxID=189513 RepID=UPI001D08A156|nr:intraflagellar transport protein 56 [Chrysoperla carnea]